MSDVAPQQERATGLPRRAAHASCQVQNGALPASNGTRDFGSPGQDHAAAKADDAAGGGLVLPGDVARLIAAKLPRTSRAILRHVAVLFGKLSPALTSPSHLRWPL